MKITKIQILLFCFSFLFLMVGNAQDSVIRLDNYSFEDTSRPGKAPKGWYNCGDIHFPLETPPDIHPMDNSSERNNFGVTQKAFHGNTYLGMVVRENESWESVAQKLEKPLSPASCYSFSIYLCKSGIYESGLRSKDGVVDFTTPIKLKIWGGNSYCDKGQLLAESPLVKNTDWQNYTFNFRPKKQYDFIILEAYFHTPTISVPNGNIMLDYASPIMLVPCGAENRKMNLTKVEDGINDSDFNINPEVRSNNHLKKELGTYEKKTLEAQVKESGPKIKFKKNQITLEGELALRRILGSLFESPNQKLIIDFGGLKEKRFKIKKDSVEKVIKDWGIPLANLEIINSKEENKEVKWIVEKDHFYMGILKNE